VREQSDTRQRIQEVALDLFTDRGYEATSLREIAEQLGVTKAALYYHFKTKEDIVTSLLDDRADALEELLRWGQAQQPLTPQARVAIVERYAAEMHSSNHHKVMRFMERNQTALRDSPKSERARDLILAMIDLITPPGSDLTTRLRHGMALFALHATWFLVPGSEVTDDERRASSLEVALDLIKEPASALSTTGGQVEA
jgi:AcrR family transcriptional regulator